MGAALRGGARPAGWGLFTKIVRPVCGCCCSDGCSGGLRGSFHIKPARLRTSPPTPPRPSQLADDQTLCLQVLAQTPDDAVVSLLPCGLLGVLRDWLKSAVESQNGGSALDILKVDGLGGIGVGVKPRATRRVAKVRTAWHLCEWQCLAATPCAATLRALAGPYSSLVVGGGGV